MTLNRTALRLAAGMLVLLLAGPALAQDLEGLQLFGQSELSSYGRGPRPNEGYFITFSELYMSIQRPRTRLVGSPTPHDVFYNAVASGGNFVGYRSLFSTLDTTQFVSPFVAGQRFEMGRVVDHWGWMVGSHRLDVQNQNFQGNNVDVSFDVDIEHDGLTILHGIVGTDPGTGNNVVARLPTTFNRLLIQNKTVNWGVEMMGLYRSRELHNGGFIEMMFGTRYFELNEDFVVSGEGGFTSIPVVFAAGNSFFVNRAENHILGPQLGLRYFKKYTRFMTSFEGRLMAGYNHQNVRQHSVIADGLPNVIGTTGFPLLWSGAASTHEAHANEWSPLAELRAEVCYQMTRNITLRAGWTGMWADGIARASSLMEYRLPELGIDMTLNRQDVFIHGLNLGIDVNR